jgi:hypothetical protein
VGVEEDPWEWVACGMVHYGATGVLRGVLVLKGALPSPPSELLGVSTEVLRVVVVGGTFRGRPRSRIGITGVDWSFSRAGVRAEV